MSGQGTDWQGTDWLSTDQFDWIAGGLACSLFIASFMMIFVTVYTRQKRS